MIRQGVGNSEACRIVGVNRRTGTRWRYGRTILQHGRRGDALSGGDRKSLQTGAPAISFARRRTPIADLRRVGTSVHDIARALGRAASAVPRELRRNTDERGRYRPATAQRLSYTFHACFSASIRPRRLFTTEPNATSRTRQRCDVHWNLPSKGSSNYIAGVQENLVGRGGSVSRSAYGDSVCSEGDNVATVGSGRGSS